MPRDTLKPPIFLLGNVRSGTSMMHDFFNLHPDVVSWYEPRTLWVYADPSRSHDVFTAKDANDKVVRYIRSRFLKYQRSHDGLRVMEKTPSNLLRIPYVSKIFPEAKYLYLVRNPLSYLSSSELKWRQPITMSHAISRAIETPFSQLPHYLGRFVKDNFNSRIMKAKHVSIWGVRYPGIYEDREVLSVEEVISKQWSYCSEHAEIELEKLPQDKIIKMRYEDFVEDASHHFKRVLEFFDLEYNERVLQNVVKLVDPNRQQKWARLDSKIIDKCLPLLGAEMRRHGYSEQELRSSLS